MSVSTEKKYILNAAVVDKKMRRMAYQILENNTDESYIILAGIRESGSVVARNIQRMLKEISGLQTEMINISIDKKNPKEVSIDKDIDFTGKVIIIMDDVANSGRTLLYALKPFLEYYPKKIQTLVLVERSHNSFPVHSDYIGLSLTTSIQEHIYVEVEGEEIMGAYMI